MSDWKRPIDFEFPRVWYRFSAPDIDNVNNYVEYKIQDVPENRYKDAVQHLLENYALNEPANKITDLINDPISLEENKEFWLSILNERVSVACFKEGSDEIIGLNLLQIRSKSDKSTDLKSYKGKSMLTCRRAFKYISDQFDIYSAYNIDRYLYAIALSVQRKYEGKGFAQRILETREFICQQFDISVASTIYTSAVAQYCAKKLNYTMNYEIALNDLMNAFDPPLEFPNLTGSETKSFKTMSVVYK